jgi:hypothetical protein
MCFEHVSVKCRPPSRLPFTLSREEMMRFIGLDDHRDFCEVALSDGGRARSAGQVATRPAQLELFAQSLAASDRVVLEATGNALAIAHPGTACG